MIINNTSSTVSVVYGWISCAGHISFQQSKENLFYIKKMNSSNYFDGNAIAIMMILICFPLILQWNVTQTCFTQILWDSLLKLSQWLKPNVLCSCVFSSFNLAVFQAVLFVIWRCSTRTVFKLCVCMRVCMQASDIFIVFINWQKANILLKICVASYWSHAWYLIGGSYRFCSMCHILCT